jgi:hypothetical protein
VLLAGNDPRLDAYIGAADRGARESEFARLLATAVDPRVRALTAGAGLPPHDADDVRAHVHYALYRKLEEGAVEDVDAYVAAVAQNAIHALLRRRAPERARLKGRLRYLLLKDTRLGLWMYGDAALCGLEEWRGRAAVAVPSLHQLPAAAGDATRPREAVAALLRACNAPVRFHELVNAVMKLWGIRDEEADLGEAEAAQPAHDTVVEDRQYLRALWDEVRSLPPNQCAALLLNLREPGGGNALLLLIVHHIATIDQVAQALGMTASALAAMWDELPMDDRAIAARLGVERQQVINYRKAARERLSRRMAARSAVRR